MNKSEIAEKAAREIRQKIVKWQLAYADGFQGNRGYSNAGPNPPTEQEISSIVERAIAESQAPQPRRCPHCEAGIPRGTNQKTGHYSGSQFVGWCGHMVSDEDYKRMYCQFAASQIPSRKDWLQMRIPCGHTFSDLHAVDPKNIICMACESAKVLGDGEPSPDYKEFDDYDSFRSKHPRLYKFWNEYDEVLRIDPIWLKFALRFAESGAAQEVSPLVNNIEIKKES
jgi:hypothetical protein